MPLVRLRGQPLSLRLVVSRVFDEKHRLLAEWFSLTNVPESVDDAMVALWYYWRWRIEISFRFFKHTFGCRSLLSHDPVGIEIQTYCAIIACMLMSLWTGRKPTLRTYEMNGYCFIGWAEEHELLAHLAKLPSRPA